jgi:xylose dehydrogenase (NAD/NADP)
MLAVPLASRVDTTRFAIMGTGKIAAKVCPLIAAADGCAVTLVASRSRERAQRFAEAHGIRAWCSYEELPGHDAADAVYLTLPNHAHPGASADLMRAGKHVLCEKPLAWRAADARSVYAVAERTGRVLVEAFAFVHTRWMGRVAELVERIGPVRRIEGYFEIPISDGPTSNVRYSRALAGGSMMDLGCYPMSFARCVTGEEPDFRTLEAGCELVDLYVDPETGGKLGADAVDGSAWAKWRTASGVEVEIASSMTRAGKFGAVVHGDGGRIEVPEMSIPNGVRVCVEGCAPEVEGTPGAKDSAEALRMYTLQAASFGRACRGEGAPTPSPQWSINQAMVMERVLAGMGLHLGKAPGLFDDDR